MDNGYDSETIAFDTDSSVEYSFYEPQQCRSSSEDDADFDGGSDESNNDQPQKKKRKKSGLFQPSAKTVDEYKIDFSWLKTVRKPDGKFAGDCEWCGSHWKTLLRENLQKHEKAAKHIKTVKKREGADKNMQLWNKILATCETADRTKIQYQKWGIILEKFLSEHISLRTVERLLDPDFMEVLKSYPSLLSRSYFRQKVP